jgi:hypothetical protein
VDELQGAIADAPRESRALQLCRMQIEGAVLSPLYWALHDGKLGITEWILKDLLTIRADLHGYYYGRADLFTHHKNLVYELGKEEPALYKPLLDGLLWHSNDKLPGRMVRVNYYVRDIYGDPVDFWDPWHSPLAHFTAFADNDTYMHPAIAKVIQLKWEAFGLKMFLAKELCFVVTLILFMICHLSDTGGCDEVTHYLLITLTSIAAVNLSCGLFVAASQAYVGKTETVSLLGWEMRVPRTFLSFWSQIRNIGCILLLLVHISHSPVGECILPCQEINSNFLDLSAHEQSVFVNRTACIPPLHLLENITVPEEAFAGSDRRLWHAKKDGTFFFTEEEPASESGPRRIEALCAIVLWIQLLQSAILNKAMAALSYSIWEMVRDMTDMQET